MLSLVASSDPFESFVTFVRLLKSRISNKMFDNKINQFFLPRKLYKFYHPLMTKVIQKAENMTGFLLHNRTLTLPRDRERSLPLLEITDIFLMVRCLMPHFVLFIRT